MPIKWQYVVQLNRCCWVQLLENHWKTSFCSLVSPKIWRCCQSVRQHHDLIRVSSFEPISHPHHPRSMALISLKLWMFPPCLKYQQLYPQTQPGTCHKKLLFPNQLKASMVTMVSVQQSRNPVFTGPGFVFFFFFFSKVGKPWAKLENFGFEAEGFHLFFRQAQSKSFSMS